jgi:predicted site-specific integrase-resolvase
VEYKPKEFSEMINVSINTLQRWDNQGVLITYRNPKERGYYTERQYREYMGIQEENKVGKTVIYTRVSNQGQKDDLENQIEFLKTFVNARGMIVDEVIIVNNEKLSPQEELLQDLISIVHVGSCRIYGLRKYKKKIAEDEDL